MWYTRKRTHILSMEENNPKMLLDEALNRINKVKREHLLELNLTELGLTFLPDEVTQLCWLKGLFLSFNAIADLQPLIGLKNLERLDLRGNQVRALQPLSAMHSLYYLDLGGNSLLDLGPIRQLTEIETLYLDQNSVSDLKPLESLKRLRRLFASENKIVSISALSGMSDLVELYLHSNRISDISPLNSCHRLVTLDLTDNAIQDLAPISQLSSLEACFIGDNAIPDLSPLATLLSRGLKIASRSDPTRNPARNPLTTPPPEIVARGATAVINYFAELKSQGSEPIYEAKLLIVGEGGAGKTTLARKLENAMCSLPDESESTMGIDVRRLVLMGVAPSRPFTLNIWDFGGQEIYHSTHQFFLTQRSLYVLVDDTRKDSKSVHDEVFAYWLQVVGLLGGNSPLLIVQNEKSDRSKQLDIASMQARFTFIKDHLATNLATNRGLDRVVNSIQHWLLRLDHIGQQLPVQWIKVRDELEVLGRSIPHISLGEYLSLCARHGLSAERRALSLAEYLHDLGAFLHFDDSMVLRDLVILQNTWATQAVYAILDDEQIKQRSGFFSGADLDRIWSREEYRSHHHHLLALMEKFELCYPLLDPVKPGWLAPQLLPIARSDSDWQALHEIVLRYEYTFMPKGILPRLIVRLNRYVKSAEEAWRAGAVFRRHSSAALVTETYAKREILVRVSGEQCRELMTIVAEEIDSINDGYPSIKVEKMIPCRCHVCAADSTPHWFRYSNLQERIRRGKKTAECERSYQNVDVAQLFEGVFASVSAKRFEDMRMFISYSHKDERYLKDLESHLASLKITNHLTVWADTEIRAGDRWDASIVEELRTADVVLLLLSADFLASRYIWETELPIALQRDELGEGIVIPIFVRPCDTTDLPLMKLQGLPRGGKAISSYRNRDEAYTEIMKQLRRRLLELSRR